MTLFNAWIIYFKDLMDSKYFRMLSLAVGIFANDSSLVVSKAQFPFVFNNCWPLSEEISIGFGSSDGSTI